MDLHERIAVITGGTRGIGFGIAKAFSQRGCHVVVSGRSAEKGDDAVKSLGAAAAFRQADSRHQSDVEALIDWTIERHGRVDILVNNAGGASGHRLVAELSDAAWQEAADWILNSAFWATRRALASMVENRWGRIISISSVHAKFARTPMTSHYATFKAALNAFSRSVAVDYGNCGITSNAICPGAVETDLLVHQGSKTAALIGLTYEEYLDTYAQDTLTKVVSTVEEIAAVALLLVSDEGAGITGTAINVDGGTSPF